MHRAAVGALALLALSVLLAGVAAQVVSVPDSSPFYQRYDVVGRLVDSKGWPANQMAVDVEVTGLRGVTVKPLRVATNCNGDFGAIFHVGTLNGADPQVKVSVVTTQTINGQPMRLSEVSETQSLDKFFRLSNFAMILKDEWPSECGRSHEYWPGRVTVSGRLVNGVREYSRNGTDKLQSEPVPYWPVNVVEKLDDGGRFPPDSTLPTDERGDFKYSWTNVKTVHGANLTAEAKGAWGNATMGPLTRIAFLKLHTGQGPRSTPMPGALGALVAVAAAAAVVARARRGRTR